METENLCPFPYTDYIRINGSGQNRVVESSPIKQSSVIELSPNTTYTFSGQKAGAADRYGRIALFTTEPIAGATSTRYLYFVDNNSVQFTTSATEIYAVITTDDITDINVDYYLMLVPGSTAPTSYIPPGYKLPLTVESEDQTEDLIVYIGDSKLIETEYVDSESGKIYKLQEGVLTPTDPPLPFPAITASGETTITTTETLGDVELTGDWLAIMGSTEDESIDIEFTVDAEEYIAFVTVDDGPSIQVSDTITMPSSADSFTLEVVAWGRERYTDTVYNALS